MKIKWRFTPKIKQKTSLLQDSYKKMAVEQFKNSVVDQSKNGKIETKQKWDKIEYNIQNKVYENISDVRMCCDTELFPALNFTCKNYHFPLD